MSRPTTINILWLFLRTGVRRVINRTLIAGEAMSNRKKSAKSTATESAAPRMGSVRRGARKSWGLRLFAVGLISAMVFGFGIMTVMPALILMGSVRIREAQTAEVIPVSAEHFARLQVALKISDENTRKEEIGKIADDIAGAAGAGWVYYQLRTDIQSRLESKGIDTVTPIEPDSRFEGDLAYLSPAGRALALQSAGLFLFFINVSLALAWFGMMATGLKGPEAELSWFLQFPASRRVLFLSKLISNTFDNPAILVTPFVTAAVLSYCGFGVGSIVALAVLMGLSSAVAFAALRLLFESFLTQKCSRKVRGTAVALAATAGSLGMMFAFNSTSTSGIAQFISSVAAVIPDVLFWNPCSACLGAVTTSEQFASLWWLAAPVGAVAFGAVAIAYSVRLLSRGLNPVNDSVRRVRKSELSSGLVDRLFGGLVWKELVQIGRQREFLFQIILAPVPILFVLYMQNPDRIFGLVLGDPGKLCAAIFTVFAYLLLCAAGTLMLSELRTLWILQSVPRSLGETIRTKSRVWAGVVISFAMVLLVATACFAPIDVTGVLVRVPFLVAFLWLFADITFGLVSLNATFQSDIKISIHPKAYLAPILIGTFASGMLYQADIWESFAFASVLYVLSLAIRQKQQVELRWITEPVEKPPVRLYAMHGLMAVLAFIGLQSPLSLVFSMMKLTDREVMALSYDGSVLIVTVVLALWMWRKKLRIETERRSGSVWKPLATATVTMMIVGASLVGILQYSPEIAAASQNSLRVATTLSLDALDSALIISMVVIVAPIFEEWIFRGLLYNSLRKSWGLAASVGVTTLLFTVIHPAVSCAAVVTLSIVTCLLVEKTGRIWPGIVAHMALNAVVVASWNLTIA